MFNTSFNNVKVFELIWEISENLPPKIYSVSTKVEWRKGEVGVLLCLSYGSPSANHW